MELREKVRHLFYFSVLKSRQFISTPDQASPAALTVEGMNSLCVPAYEKAPQIRLFDIHSKHSW